MDTRELFALLALLLDYPDRELHAEIKREPEAFLTGEEEIDKYLRDFYEFYASRDYDELCSYYVANMDMNAKGSLYLTYHRHGEGKTRGADLVRLKSIYTSAGLEPGKELPDYLPVILEFGARKNPQRALEILLEFGEEIESARRHLEETNNPYALPLAAVLELLKSVKKEV